MSHPTTRAFDLRFSSPEPLAPPDGPLPLPRVILHSAITVDGRIIDADLEDPIAARLPHDAVLVSAPTVLVAAEAEGHDMSIEDPTGTPPPRSDPRGRPWLVIVDPHGLVRRWNWLRTQAHWRDLLVAVSTATPTEHLARLRRHGVHFLVTGADEVDVTALLALLATDYGVDHARVGSHGRLSGALLAARLVDELSLVVLPQLSPGSAPYRFNPLEATHSRLPVGLALTHVEQLPDDAVWLRYRVLSKREEFHPAELE